MKEYLAEQMLYKKYHFKCDCLISLDFVGVINNYRISNNNIIFYVATKGKDIEIDENHPNLLIEPA